MYILYKIIYKKSNIRGASGLVTHKNLTGGRSLNLLAYVCISRLRLSYRSSRIDICVGVSLRSGTVGCYFECALLIFRISLKKPLFGERVKTALRRGNSLDFLKFGKALVAVGLSLDVVCHAGEIKSVIGFLLNLLEFNSKVGIIPHGLAKLLVFIRAIIAGLLIEAAGNGDGLLNGIDGDVGLSHDNFLSCALGVCGRSLPLLFLVSFCVPHSLWPYYSKRYIQYYWIYLKLISFNLSDI